MHWSPNFSAASFTNARRATAPVLIETLSAPARNSARMSSIVRTPPPTVSGMKQASAVRWTTSRMMARSSWLAVMSRKVNSSAPAVSYATAASTGSPASRRLTKLMPLTTRPSLTSRQGITRTLNMVPCRCNAGTRNIGHASAVHRSRQHRRDQRQRGRRIEPSIIECTARNGTLKLARAWRDQRSHVLERRKPTRGDHRDRDCVRERDGGIEVEALEQAVARDVGVDDRRDARVLEAARDIERRQLGGLRPAFHRDLAVARVEPDRHAIRERARGVPHQLRIAHGGSANDHAVDALAEPAFDCRHVADAAAELHRDRHRLEDAIDRRRVDRLARQRTIEVDDVEILETLRLECTRLRGRIAIEDGGARHVALLETHRQPFLEVDGREQDHGAHVRKFAISFSPNRWLFSG